MELGRHYKHDDSELDITFEIYDYVRDIRELLDDISNTFEMSWESTFQVLCEFINQNKHFPYQKEKYNGLSLGRWCDSQKMMYRNGRISEARINALEEIGFPWDCPSKQAEPYKSLKNRVIRIPDFFIKN